FFQAEDGIRDRNVTGVQTCALPISQSLVVTIPPPTGAAPPAAPTGIVFNNTTNFIVASNAPARFIFATEDGTIAAWASGANAVRSEERRVGKEGKPGGGQGQRRTER